jgi:hypothetical protein
VFVLAFLLAAAIGGSTQTATIVNRAASPAGYRIAVRRDAPAEVTAGGAVEQKQLDAAAVDQLFEALAAAGPLDRLAVRACAKTMSSGSLSVTYLGRTSPGDLTCGGDAHAQALLAAVRAVAKQAGLTSAPLRRVPPSGDGAGATR